MILTQSQISSLKDKLCNRLLSVCFGSGVDSTAMLVAMHEAGIRPDIITFGDTGGEKPETMTHLVRMNAVLASWNWPLIDVCKKKTLPTTAYDDLYGNCTDNETLPSLAFGMKSCSIKWKATAQDQFIKGVKAGLNRHAPHPVWLEAKASGARIFKCIGYDCGRADMRRSKKPPPADADFDYIYPLQLIGWERQDCVSAIAQALGADMVPIKSACFFCPASKTWELFWLAAHHPDLFEKALFMERKALTGKHSRFTEVEFGATWDEMVLNADRFPSTNTCVGLGRSFAWSQWARINDVVDEEFKVKRTDLDKERFLVMSKMLQKDDNALDNRINQTKLINIHLLAA